MLIFSYSKLILIKLYIIQFRIGLNQLEFESNRISLILKKINSIQFKSEQIE
jgi:hypothetical protein